MFKLTAVFLSLALCVGCMTRSTVMTRETFDEVSMGTTAQDIVLCAGQPYKSYCVPGGKEEYVYIERLKLGNNVIIENHYVIAFLDGRVISKRFTQERPPAYDIIYRDNPTLTY